MQQYADTYYLCVLKLVNMHPHIIQMATRGGGYGEGRLRTTVMRPRTTICVLVLLYMCTHTAICVLIQMGRR